MKYTLLQRIILHLSLSYK